MIKIHSDLCKGCGECVSVCHERCMKLVDKKASIDYSKCSTCGQCAAICPERALWWFDRRPDVFNTQLMPGSEQVEELLMERRTNRHFNPEKPPRNLTEEIINMGAYAPTHDFNMRCIAVDDDAVIDIIDAELFKKTKLVYDMFFRPPIIKWLLQLMPEPVKKEFIKAEPKLEASINAGRAYILRPPVIIYVIGDKSTPLSLESAQYSIYNIDIYARALGLGFRNLTGNNMFVNNSSKIRKILGIKNNESIFAAGALGFISKKFRNKMVGKTFPLSWNSATGKNETI